MNLNHQPLKAIFLWLGLWQSWVGNVVLVIPWVHTVLSLEPLMWMCLLPNGDSQSSSSIQRTLFACFQQLDRKGEKKYCFYHWKSFPRTINGNCKKLMYSILRLISKSTHSVDHNELAPNINIHSNIAYSCKPQEYCWVCLVLGRYNMFCLSQNFNKAPNTFTAA